MSGSRGRERGSEDRQRYLERFWTRNSRHKGAGISRGQRLLVRFARWRNNRRIVCSFHESERKGARCTADNSVSEPRSHCHQLPPPFLASSFGNLRISSNLGDTRGADIKSSLAQWYALRYRIFRGSMAFISPRINDGGMPSSGSRES